MKAFRYAAIGPGGRRVGGTVLGPEAGSARDQLLARGLHPLWIRRAWLSPVGRLRPTEAEAARFAKSLAQLTGSGVSMAQALGLVESRETGRLALLAREVRARLVAGEPLSSALGAGEGAPVRLLQTLTRAGETAGRQVEVLNDAAKSLAASAALKRRIVTLSLYPAFVIAVALGSIAVYAYAVLPALEPAFEGMGGELPAQTRAVLTFGAVVRAVLPGMALVLGLAGLVWTLLPRVRPAIQDILARALMRGRRSTLADVLFAGLCARLAVMISAGVPAAVAWRFAIEPVSVASLKRDLAAQTSRLMEGEAVSVALSRIRACPREAVDLVALGERAGRVAEPLQESSELLATRSQEALERWLSILTPVVIVAVGALVGLITMMVFQGLLAVSDAVSG